MKKLLAFTIFALVVVSCNLTNKETFTIQGEVKGLNTKMIYLTAYDIAQDNEIYSDSVMSDANGEFEFYGSVPHTIRASISAKNLYAGTKFDSDEPLNIGNSSFYLENAQIVIKCDATDGNIAKQIESFKVSGGKENSLQVILDEKLNEIGKNDGSPEDFKSFLTKFISENSSSAVAANVALEFVEMKKNPNEIREFIAMLDAKSENVKPYIEHLTKMAEDMDKIAIGKPFIDFSAPDKDGKMVALSSVAGKGKWVLLDFWAAWCGPCRTENPKLVAAYKEFKDKGFTIFGYSLDETKESWIDAIKKDKLGDWVNVSDLKGFETNPINIYRINSIPSNFLIDPDGNIAAVNLRGDKLTEFLQKNLLLSKEI